MRDLNGREKEANSRHVNRRDTDDQTPDKVFDRNYGFDDIIDDIDDRYHDEQIHHKERPDQEDTGEEMPEDAFDRNDDNDDNDWNQDEYENDMVEDPEGEEDEFDDKDRDVEVQNGESQALAAKDEHMNNPKG